jgi:arylsulfatase A-like enzyme
VVSAIKKAGLMDQTVIIFTSDNGTTHEGRGEPDFHIGGVDALFFNSTLNLRGYKGSVYEGGLRVPCIVRLPGDFGAGRVIDAPAWFPDIFPTICDIAGIKKPPNLDGISLWKFLEQEASLSSRPSPILWVFPEYGGQMAVRMNNMKAVRRNLKASKAKWSPWEVYDLANDPAEKIDLAEKRPDIIAAAVKVLRQQITPNSVFPMPRPEM